MQGEYGAERSHHNTRLWCWSRSHATDVVMQETLVAQLRHIDDICSWLGEIPVIVDLMTVEGLPLAHHQICGHVEPEMMRPLHPVVGHNGCVQVLRHDLLA